MRIFVPISDIKVMCLLSEQELQDKQSLFVKGVQTEIETIQRMYKEFYFYSKLKILRPVNSKGDGH